MNRKKKIIRSLDNKSKIRTLETISIVVLMVLVVASSMIVIVPERISAASSDFTYNKLITIDHTKCSGSNSNIVIWVHNTSTDFKSVANGGKLQADADDIAFFSQDNNTQYKHDIELYDAATGEIGIWVNISDAITDAADFTFYCYYNDTDGTDQRDMDGTWDSKYSGVYHMNTSSATVFDSSGNGHVLSENGNPTYAQTGKTGNSVYADGDGDAWNCSNHADFNMGAGNFTFVVWVKPDSTMPDWTKDKSIIAKGSTNTGTKSRYLVISNSNYATQKPLVDLDSEPNDKLMCGNTNISDAHWHHMVVQRENNVTAGHDYMRLYLNATLDNSSDMEDHGSLDDTAKDFVIGPREPVAAPANCFKGYIDEVWIIKGQVMTPEWINTTHNNQNDSTFLTFEEESGASTFTIKGLQNDIITFSGVAGSTVYCNSSGDTNEWLEYNMSINATDNVTELRVFMDDLNDTSAYINASNITMYVSSDNSSYGEMGTFTDGGSNCSNAINSTNWNAGTMGADPFSGVGLTDKDTSIYLIFKITFPSGAPTDIFWSSTSLACKIYPGHYE